MSTIIGLVSTFRLPLHDSSLLDFNTPSHRFNVRSAAARLPFWTSTRLPTASTSNSPRFGFSFGLQRAFPLL